mmetsp:Transcript_2556/g.6148  ORF Transcript_2556/g.6148 Transcript_2556/m.6148 type:complete len:149 (-) Transcript_2556:492-938(-)
MCANNSIAMGSYAAMMVEMDLVQFYTSTSRWLSPKPEYDKAMHLINGGELPMSAYAWRTGTHFCSAELYSKMMRVCRSLCCISNPVWMKRHIAYGCAKKPPSKQLWGTYFSAFRFECRDQQPHSGPGVGDWVWWRRSPLPKRISIGKT